MIQMFLDSREETEEMMISQHMSRSRQICEGAAKLAAWTFESHRRQRRAGVHRSSQEFYVADLSGEDSEHVEIQET